MKTIRKITVVVLCFTLALGLFGGCAAETKDTAMTEILEKNGYGNGECEVEKVIDLPSGIEGLPPGEENKLLLIKDNGYYAFAVVNTEEESVTDPVYGFVPLNVVQQEIWGMEKEKNIECIDIFKSYIEQYGVNCMETKSCAESFLRELTEKDVISVDTAQNIVSNSTMQIFPDIKSNDEVVVIFEKNTAVPSYYTTRSSMTVYNWNSMWSEENYNLFVKTSLTQEQLSAIASVYGPPYSEKTVWAVVDSDLKEVGIYDSLDEVKRKYQR